MCHPSPVCSAASTAFQELVATEFVPAVTAAGAAAGVAAAGEVARNEGEVEFPAFVGV